jgi:hypothetical protein
MIKTFLAVPLLAVASCGAATTIQISARIADVAAGTVVPASPELLAKTKGANVLSAPKVATVPGQAATIEVNQNVSAPDGSVVPLGVTLTIKPRLTEKGNIAFSGKATDRFKHGERESESLSVLMFVARETHFKGVAASGSTVVLSGTPAISGAAKKDAPGPTMARELVIYLTFKKIVTEEQEKNSSTAGKSSKSAGSTKRSSLKPGTSGKSSSPAKKTSSPK